MIKSKENLLNNVFYLITPSLLNAWAYIENCQDNVFESEKDEICLEDKKEIARQKAFESFIDTLKRIPSPPNEYMLAGIQYEEDTYKGNTDASPIVMGGVNQIVGKKVISIDGVNFLLYGRLDVLKAGVIYDIKRVVKYSLGKYKGTFQHPVYFELFPNAYKFEYLIYDGNKLHREQYFRDECENIHNVIRDFIRFLKDNNLLDLYKEKWKG